MLMLSLQPPAALGSYQFAMLHAMTHGNHTPLTIGVAVAILEDMQLFSFALRPVNGYARMPNWFPLLFNPMSAKPENDAGFAALFYIAVILVASTALLTAVVGGSLRGVQITIVWPLQGLRVFTTLLSTILFIPLLEIFLNGLLCYDPEAQISLLINAPAQCLQAQFLPRFLLSIVSLVYLAVQGVVMSLIFFRITPSGDDPHAKTTGRVEAFYTCCRIVLTVCQLTFDTRPIAPCIVLVVTSAAMFYLTCRYQPHFRSEMNDLRAAIFLGSFVCALVSTIVAAKADSFIDSFVPFAVGCIVVVPGMIAGALGCRGCRSKLTNRVYGRLKAASAAEAHEISGEIKGPVRESLYRPSISGLKLRSFNDQIERDVEGNSPDRLNGGLPDIDLVVTQKDPKRIIVFASSCDVELSLRFLQRNTNKEAKRLASQLLRRAAEQFPDNAMVWLMMAYYTSQYDLGSSAEVLDCISKAKMSRPAADTRFFIFTEEMSVDQDRRMDDLVASSMGIARFSEVNTLEEEAEQFHLETLIAIKRLWSFLRVDKDKIGCVPFLLQQVEEKRAEAVARYSRLVRKFPNSKKILQSYVTFLLKATQDEEAAKKLLLHVQQLEKDELRSNAMAAANSSLRHSKTRDVRDGSAAADSTSQNWESQNVGVSWDDDIEVGEEASTIRRPFPSVLSTRVLDVDTESQEPAQKIPKSVTMDLRRLLTEPTPEQPNSTGKADSLPAATSHFPERRAPRSVHSNQSSFKDRNARFLKDVIAKRMKAPINAFVKSISAALCITLALMVIGFALGLVAYRDIVTDLPIAYDQTRPRVTGSRFAILATRMAAISDGLLQVGNATAEYDSAAKLTAYQLNNLWKPLTDGLLSSTVTAPANILIRNRFQTYDQIQRYNAFLLSQLITTHVEKIVKLTMANARASPSVQWFDDNVRQIVGAFEAAGDDAYSEFLTRMHNWLQGQIAVLVLLGVTSIIFAAMFIRPTIRREHGKLTSLLSVFSDISREHATQMVESYSADIESMMETMEQGETFAKIAASNEAALPSPRTMLNAGPRKHLKRVILYFSLLALTSSAIVIPSSVQAWRSSAVIGTLNGIGRRNYLMVMTTAFAQYAAYNKTNDATSPNLSRAWLRYYHDAFVEQNAQLVTESGGYPSLYSYPNLANYLRATGTCFSRQGCSPSTRTFNESIGLTYNLVTSRYENILSTWEQCIASFLAKPPWQQSFTELELAYQILDDISSGAKKLTDVIVSDVGALNQQFELITIIAFVGAILVFVTGYVIVVRQLIKHMRGQIDSCLWMCFTLPPEVTLALPELKRFIESAGAIMPRRAGSS
ncbi:hypothetical protein HDU89_000700 [Geranomyces variabilis]|nr:hypothetical protein HDU89_000700 [Geranomyces variabilis]